MVSPVPPDRLIDRLPATPDPDLLFDAFSSWAEGRGLPLYPAQAEALIEVVSGANVVLATPTGSGKSLVANGAQFAALSQGRRTFYTAPIKALVSEKFFALTEVFGAEQVGMMTGDASVNPGAPVVCATAEVLANLALRQGPQADVGQVVMDEFHYYADPDRGWAWQVPLLELPQAQFLLMSATLGDVTRISEDLTRRTGRPTAHVTSVERPVPLVWAFSLTPLQEALEELLATREAPIYVVHPTQAAAVERASALMSINICTREEKDAIAELLGAFRFASGFGKTLSRLVRHGIGVHHAGMLPKYRRLVERLAQAGLLKVVCGTDTLGVGINLPIRTVLFTSLSKYDGTRVRLVKAREFHQIAGRAGRAGYDTIGRVVVQAPEHVIDNEKMVAKAGDDPKKLRKLVRKKPPEGMVSWGRPTFERLVEADPEPLTSSFRVTTAMLLNLAGRPGDPVQHTKKLLLDNHEEPGAQRRHVRRALALHRALRAAGVVERGPDGTVRLTVDLPPHFALDQPLSPFALAAVELLDPAAPAYPLDVLSVLEATLDDPRQVLTAQRFKARGEAVQAMKAEGIEYEERMELLEEIAHPQPLADLLLPAFETYRRGHPWVADFALSPKAIARDLYEQAMTFGEYVQHYGLERSEGLVLRYLADAYKALSRAVSAEARTPDLEELTEWLGELVRQTDSSLLDEWERLRDPTALPAEQSLDDTPPPVTANRRAFRALVRNELFRRVRLAAQRRWWELGPLDEAAGWDADAWQAALTPYWEEHDEIGTGPDARGPGLFVVDERADRWVVRQLLDDPADDHDWRIDAEVDLAASDAEGRAVVRVTEVGRLDGV